MLTPTRVIAVAAAALALIVAPIGIWRMGSTDPAAQAPVLSPPTDCPTGTPLPNGTIATIAGTGKRGFSGDSGPALAATLGTWDMATGFTGHPAAVDADGAFYFSDQDGQSVRRVGVDGIITTVAGPSTGAPIVTPGGLAFDDNGGLYIADPGAARIWRLDPQGVITPVAGTGEPGSDGDEGPATQARIQAGGVLVGGDGELYLDDVNRIRMIGQDGVIHAFAGTGTAGFAGDGGLAVEAQLGDSAGPSAITADGSVIITDPTNMRIRRVDPSGTIETIVGSGQRGTAGDDGPALEATLMPSPYGVAIGPDGTLFFSDWQANRVRRVDPEGIITTIAGGGTVAANLGDCGPATTAILTSPQAIFLHEGDLFIVDGGHNRIRLVTGL